MRKVALAIVLLASTSVLAAEQWTEEEQTSGVKKVEYVRYAFAGQKMKLQLLSAMDMDCSIVEGWAFEIIKQPEHGTAEIVPLRPSRPIRRKIRGISAMSTRLTP